MAPYQIATDERRHHLRATLRGFWDVATTTGYLDALTAAAAKISRDGAASWWLIDMSNSQVQSREVSALMGGTLPTLFTPATTVAIVVDGRLAEVQAKRIVPNDQHRYFPTLGEAEEWLIARGMPG